MLGEPALLAGLPGAKAEGMALLAEQGIATVPRADAPDELLLGEVQDEAVVGRQIAEGVQAGDEVVVAAHVLYRHLSHASHQVHARDDVGAVRDHDAHAGQRRAGRTHEIRDDVHGAAAHGAGEVAASPRLGIGGRHPVIGGPRVVLCPRADVGQLLGARHVGRMAAVQVTAGIGRLVQFEQRAVPQHQLDEPVVLRLRAVAPHRPFRTGEAGGIIHPFLDNARQRHLGLLPARARCRFWVGVSAT